MQAKKILNLGCGAKRMSGAINLDSSERVGADVIHDLNKRPWPFESDSFDEVHAYDVIEHLDDIIATFEEIHRVGKSEAHVHVTVPHFSSANTYIDPTHRHAFASSSFSYLTGEHEHSHYTGVRFRTVTKNIVFSGGPINRVVSWAARRAPDGYEARWAWTFPRMVSLLRSSDREVTN